MERKTGYDGLVSRHLNREISRPITRLLAPTGITPNQVTFISFLIALLASAAFALGSNVLGGLLAQFSFIVDGVDGELWLLNTRIAPYAQASRQNNEPGWDRKLLMHRREINHLQGKAQEKGYTIVPLHLYLRDNRAKVEIALVAVGRSTTSDRPSPSARPAADGACGKKRFEAQEVLAQLNALAHNVVIWSRGWLAPAYSRLWSFGILRMVRDVFQVSGAAVFQGEDRLCQIILNEADPLANGLCSGPRALLAPLHVTVNLGEI